MIDWRLRVPSYGYQQTPGAWVGTWPVIATLEEPPPPEFCEVSVSRRWLRRTPYVHADIERVFHALLRLDMETGIGNSDEPHPEVSLRWSDDGGHTYNDPRTVSAGVLGNYRARADYRRLGMARSRLYEFSGDDPVKIALVNAYLFLTSGRH